MARVPNTPLSLEQIDSIVSVRIAAIQLGKMQPAGLNRRIAVCSASEFDH